MFRAIDSELIFSQWLFEQSTEMCLGKFDRAIMNTIETHSLYRNNSCIMQMADNLHELVQEFTLFLHTHFHQGREH